MLKKLKTGLILLLLIEVSCLKSPVSGNGNVSSVLFSFSARIEGKYYHSLRLYINSDGNKMQVNILLPTNKLIANVFYSGSRLIILDYDKRIAYIDNKKPFTLKRVLGFEIPLSEFVKFYNNCYLKKECKIRKGKNMRFIVNKKQEIIITGQKGNILLKPLSGVVKGKVGKFNSFIPDGFKVIYVNN